MFPLLIVGNTTLIAISTLLSEISFYTRLLKMRDKTTNLPLFNVLSVTLACAKCREDGKAAECPHMLHLIPRYTNIFHLFNEITKNSFDLYLGGRAETAT